MGIPLDRLPADRAALMQMYYRLDDRNTANVSADAAFCANEQHARLVPQNPNFPMAQSNPLQQKKFRAMPSKKLVRASASLLLP